MGPNTEPWVTPDNTGSVSELTPSMTTFLFAQIAKSWSIGGYHFGYNNIPAYTLASIWNLIESLGKIQNNEVCLIVTSVMGTI